MELRDKNLERLASEDFDVLIVGSGINGAVSAAALAARGVRVALIDARDFAGFTSAWPYWITAWAGNAGIVVVWVIYVQALFGFPESGSLHRQAEFGFSLCVTGQIQLEPFELIEAVASKTQGSKERQLPIENDDRPAVDGEDWLASFRDRRLRGDAFS